MYEDVMVLGAGMAAYTLPYSDIDNMEFNAFQVIINHHNPLIPKDITIDGFFIKNAIRQALKKHCLPIDIRENP